MGNDSMISDEDIEHAARLGHEACRNCGASFDSNAELPWDQAPAETKEAVRARVEGIITNPDAPPDVAGVDHPDVIRKAHIFHAVVKDALKLFPGQGEGGDAQPGSGGPQGSGEGG